MQIIPANSMLYREIYWGRTESKAKWLGVADRIPRERFCWYFRVTFFFPLFCYIESVSRSFSYPLGFEVEFL